MKMNWLTVNNLSVNLFIVFVCIILSTNGASNNPTWITNTDIKGGTVTICSNAYTYGGLYQSTYSSSFSAAPNVGISVPSIDINPGLNQMLWKINLPQSTNTTHIKISIIYVNTIYITFKVSFLAVSGSLTYLKVGYFQLGEAQINPLVNGAGTRSVQAIINLPITYNSTSNMSIIPYLSGLKIYTVSGDRGFSLVLTKNNDTSIIYNATCIGTTKVTEIVSYILFYDITLGEATQEIFLDYQPLTAINNALNNVSLLYYDPVNMLVGINQFYFSNGFSFNLDTSTLSLTVPRPGAAFTNMTLSFWSFRKRNCLAATPFFQKNSNLCYDVCPTGYLSVTSGTSKYCQSCSTYIANCIACTSSTQCTQCAVGWMVNPITKTCICASGYYSSGGSCLACHSSCLTCSGGTSTSCSSCSSGKYLSGSTCMSCDPSCATCSGSSTNCLTCPPGYTFSNGTCFVCHSSCNTCSGGASNNCLSCKTSAEYLSATNQCLACTSPCLTCSGSSTNCLTCSPGYTFSNGTCFICDSSCNTCSGGASNNCLSCKTSGEYLSATNQCLACTSPCLTCSSATTCLSCPPGKYLTVMNSCAACDVSCKTCSSSASSCTSCNSDRTLTGSACVCNSGSEDDSGNCISLCTESSCNLCPTNNSVCEQCKPSFILSGGRCHCPSSTFYSIADNTCYSCNETCAICSGPTANECTGCQASQNRELNTSTFACDCKATFYAPNNELTCIKSPSNTCPNNFVYNSTTGYCVEICGDGKLFELQCDDGNTDAGDGCDASCNVQSGFSCLYGDAQSPSICSYDGQINFTLIFAEKDLYSNQINLEYKLLPLLKFYEKFPNFTASLIISDPTFTIFNAIYSKESQTLKVNVRYNQTPADKTVSISYTPASSPYSHALVSSSYYWPVKVGNGLTLTYYSDETYKNAKIYDYLTLGVFIGSLFVFVLALFFRKMIGVEMILLIQTQVISLSMLKQIHPYLSVLTVEKYAFGYNQFEYLMGMKKFPTSENVGLYSVIGFSQIFGENVNIMFFAICVFYLLAIIIGLISSCKQKATAKKIKEAALIFAREIAFGLLLFSLMNMITSYALETFTGNIWNYDPEYSGTIKIGSIILIAANYGVYGLYFKESVESYVFYEKRSRISQLQPLFIATKAILIAAGIALYQKFDTPVLYALLALQGTYIVLVIVLRPFKRKIDLARSLIVELSTLYVIGSRFVLIQFVKLENPGDWQKFLEYGLLGQHGLAGFSLLMSLISLIFHLFKANKADAQINPEQFYSECDAEDEKQKQKSFSRHSKSTHYPIQDYLQNYLQDDRKINNQESYKRRNKLYTEKEIKKNSNLVQLIRETEGNGYDSKRKLKDNNMAQSMEIIEMDD